MMYNIGAAAALFDEGCDRSFPSPERSLFLRLEDLESRLEELKGQRSADFDSFSDEDLSYALPECFESAGAVSRAIMAVKEKLLTKYGIDADDYRFCGDRYENDECEQVTFAQAFAAARDEGLTPAA